MHLKRYFFKINWLFFLLLPFFIFCFSVFFSFELFGEIQKKPQNELELKLEIPQVTINWKNRFKIVSIRNSLVPPKDFKVSFSNLLIESEFPDIPLPARFFPSESKLDLELAYAGYSWYLDLFADMKELFETGRAHLYKKSPVEALYYFKKSRDKAKEEKNVLYFSASLFWGIEALLQMNEFDKANLWREELLKIKNNVSLPYVLSARFFLALQACKNKNYTLCLRHLQNKDLKVSLYSRNAMFLKAWVLYKQRKLLLAKKTWISLAHYKGQFQAKSLINAGIISAQSKNFLAALDLFNKGTNLLKKMDKKNSSYESVAMFGKAWSELMLRRYNNALLSFKLFEKMYPIHILGSSAQVGTVSAKLRLYRNGKLGINEVVKSVENFTKFLPESNQIENIYLELAWILFEKKEYSRALRYANKVSNQSPLRRIYPIALILEGLCFYQKGKYAKSFGILKRANELVQYRSFQGEERLKKISNLFFSFAAIRLKDYKLGEKTLKSLMQLTKNKRNYLHHISSVWYGEVLLETSQYKSAEEVFASLPSSSPSFLQAQMGLAWIYFLRRQWRKSASLFEKIFYLSPHGKFAPQALFRSAESRFNLGEYQKAVDIFDSVEKRFHGTLVSERALYQKIKLLIQRNKLEIAESALSKFLEKYSKSIFLDELKFSYALMPFYKLNFKVSLKRLKDFVENNSDSNLLPKAYLRIGDAQYNLRQFKKAEITYSLIARKFPLHPEAREAAYSFAMTNARRKKFSEFLIQARQVIRKSPKDILSIALSFQIAETFFSQRKLEQAFEEYLQIFAEHPNSPFAAQALFRISMIHRMKGKIDASLNSYEKVLKKYPKHSMRPDVLFGLGNTLFKIGRCSESQKWLVLFLSEFPGHSYVSLARYHLGICYKKLGEQTKSIEQFSKVIKGIGKNNIELRVNSMLELGGILIKAERFTEAKKTLLPASKLNDMSISARAQYLLVRILEKTKVENAGIRYLNLAYKFSNDRDIVCKSLLRSASIYELRKNFSTAQKILRKVQRSVNLEKCNKIATDRLQLISHKIRID